MTGEEVPQDVLDAAQRGYSMHGAGLTANIVAAAWPAIARQVREAAADELFQRFQRMREEGEHDMRTALHHVRDVLRTKS